MDHLTLKAVTTTTDQGTFHAVISTESLDRERDVVSAAGMVAALKKWNRPLPLAWEHSTEARDIFGSIDPQSAVEVSGEVVVDGKVDLESEVGREAWRSFKARTLGFSFGYLVLKSVKRADGGREIAELDVFEVTATATPMNNGTRVLFTKAMPMSDRQDMAGRMREMADMMAADPMPMSEAEMAQRMRAMADEMSAAKHLTDLPVDDAEMGVALKAVWSTSYINDLPDSCFLYIEPGGEKDSEGKTTPRSLRHFPVKDADGNIDMPHLRNALSRIPQSSLPQSVKDAATAKAQRMMDNMKSLANDNGNDEEPTEANAHRVEEPKKANSAPSDSLRKESMSLLAAMTRIEDVPRYEPEPKPPEPVRPSTADLRRSSFELISHITR